MVVVSESFSHAQGLQVDNLPSPTAYVILHSVPLIILRTVYIPLISSTQFKPSCTSAVVLPGSNGTLTTIWSVHSFSVVVEIDLCVVGTAVGVVVGAGVVVGVVVGAGVVVGVVVVVVAVVFGCCIFVTVNFEVRDAVFGSCAVVGVVFGCVVVIISVVGFIAVVGVLARVATVLLTVVRDFS